MHSTILEISENNIKSFMYKEKFIEEYGNEFFANIGDYVNDFDSEDEENSRIKEEIEILKFFSEKFIYDEKDNSIIFKDGFKEEFFSRNFDKFKKFVSNVDIEDYSGATFANALRCILDGDSSCYTIFHDISTISEFIRMDMKYGKRYYISSALDYHR